MCWCWGSRTGTQKGVSLSAERLPLLSPSTCTPVVSVFSATLPRVRNGSFRWVLPPRRQVALSADLTPGSRRGVHAQRLLAADARTSWSQRPGSQRGPRGRCSPLPSLLRGARGAAQTGRARGAHAPPLAIIWGRALQVPVRRPRRVSSRAPCAWDAEREPGAAAPRVSPGDQRQRPRSQLPRRALCARRERNHRSRDSGVGVSVLLKRSWSVCWGRGVLAESYRRRT